MHNETGMTPSSPESMKTDSRVPGAVFVCGCLEWLLGTHCSAVIVESTGTDWVPVWNVLHERVAVIVANPEQGKARRGEKTDPEGSRRLAERLRVGDVRGSLVPSAQIVELRDRNRRRKRLWSAASSERNRIQKRLEPANVKVGSGQRRFWHFRTAHSPRLVNSGNKIAAFLRDHVRTHPCHGSSYARSEY
jgi:hypothetical protein